MTAEVHPDPSTFGQPEAAPVAAPAPAEPAPIPAEPAPAAPVEAPAPEEPVLHEVLRRVEDGWHVLSGLSNGVTLPPSKR